MKKRDDFLMRCILEMENSGKSRGTNATGRKGRRKLNIPVMLLPACLQRMNQYFEEKKTNANLEFLPVESQPVCIRELHSYTSIKQSAMVITTAFDIPHRLQKR
ncbi:hypothetical protein [Flavisolibacter nicotianae]|uniref:hypothetical protein n=1 Tax=Flavisolibacter nicotianae TaxID=2364882 RepID=UPI000EAF7613|nr:hypothetical protein [Flavisolibacter nicotianae]